MQNKLNEILELCIEKSNRDNYMFYSFSYCSMYEQLTIEKIHRDKSQVELFDVDFLDQALEYMQNE